MTFKVNDNQYGRLS